MNRLICAASFSLCLFAASAASSQTFARSSTGHNPFPQGRIEGRVVDAQQHPIAGAMVSVLGRITAAAATDQDGRYSIKDLPYGPYVLIVHSRGYWQSRARTVQLTEARLVAAAVELTRPGADKPASISPSSPVAAPPTQLAGFGEIPLPVGASSSPDPDGVDPRADDGKEGETAWRLLHLPRNILKNVAGNALWMSHPSLDPKAAEWFGHAIAVGPAALFGDLALSGQINLLTTESFDRTGELLNPSSGRSVAFVSVGTQAAGGAWSMQGATTQGDLASWIVAGSYKSIASARHAFDVGLSYSTQRYDGGNAAALAAIRESARNVGTLYGFDQWTVSPRLIVGYGAAFARYDYLAESGLWSPRLSVTIPVKGLRMNVVASRQAVVPGAEEFAPSFTALWLPPERTFSSLAIDGAFHPEETRHAEMAVARDVARGVSLSVRAFTQDVSDQLIELFGGPAGKPDAGVGHYYVGTVGDVTARGWGAALTHEIPSYLRTTIEYTVASAYWRPSFRDAGLTDRSLAALLSAERVHDFQATVDANIPRTSTKVYARYRIDTAFWSPQAERLGSVDGGARFHVRVNQSLPFLHFSNADWEMLLDVRNMFREDDSYASLYDEALVLRAPKRLVGGLLVKF